MRLSLSKSPWYLANSERASTSRSNSTMPTTSCVSTPRGMMRSERLRAYACRASNVPVSSAYVVVVHRRRFGEDLLLRHRREQLGPRDAPRPLLAQLRAVLSQVRYQLAQQRRGGLR